MSDSNATTVLTNQRFVGPEAKLIIVNVPIPQIDRNFNQLKIIRFFERIYQATAIV